MSAVALIGAPPRDELQALSSEMIAYAIKYPCFCPLDNCDPNLYRQVGLNYNVGLALDWYESPRVWHGSVGVIHDIASGTDMNFGIPDQAMLAVPSWDSIVKKEVADILGEIMRPLILKKDQRIDVIEGMLSVHWKTEVQRK